MNKTVKGQSIMIEDDYKQVEQEIYASFCESYAGGVKIYAAEKPSEAVIIPLILIHK